MNAEATTAGLGQRLVARVIDWLCVLVIIAAAQAVSVLVDGAIGTTIGLLLYAVAVGFTLYNQVVRVGRQGGSLGKMVLSVRVVDERTREPIGIGRALARELVLGLLAGICLVPALVNLVVAAKDPRRQGWHDKAAASLVVRAGEQRSEGGESGRQAASPPSPATGASPSTPYAPTIPPPPGVSAPPAPEPSVDEPSAATTSGTTAPPPSGMVAPPPGVTPPPSQQASSTPQPPTDTGPVEETVMRPVAQKRAAAESAGRGWTVIAPDGARNVIDGPVLLGRDPDPTLVHDARVWSIDDPQLTMSKTHALLGIEEGVAWVEDWASTNGVALHRGEAQLVLEPHARTPLRDGDVIELGACLVSVEAGE